MPKYRRYYLPNHTVFSTIVTHRRIPWLAHPHNIDMLRMAFYNTQQYHPFRHIAHVIMKDHLHWMFIPTDNSDFSKIIGAFKRECTWHSKKTGLSLPKPLWQKRFYDHVIRDEEDFQRHLDYVHFNPVKHGDVNNAHQYPHSSLNTWTQRGVYDAQWGSIEPESIRQLDLE